MGEYISRSYVGDGWVVNFADAPPRCGYDPYLVYRFGKLVGSKELMQFAALNCNKEAYPQIGTDIFRCFANFIVDKELKSTQPKHVPLEFTWYPQTELCFLRNGEGCFAAKGGHNNESHNHNDVGNFCFWKNNTPIFIDAGGGTYTAKYFSSERYTLKLLQSNYHNVPMINGVAQLAGQQFHSSNAKASKNHFSVDIAAAYPASANVNKWVRSYQLKKHELIIEDNFELKEVSGVNQVNFLCWGDVKLNGNQVTLTVDKQQVKMYFNPKLLEANVETVVLDDAAYKNNWKVDHLYRLTFKDKQRKKSGKYSFTVKF